MKRLLAFILAALIAVSFSACSPKAEEIPNIEDSPVAAPEEAQNGTQPKQEPSNDSSKENTQENKQPTKTEQNSGGVATVPNENNATNEKENPPSNESAVENTEPTGINVMRPDYNLGTCRSLEGDVTVVIFYLDDFESSWSNQEITNFTEKEIKPGLEFLENSAKKHGVDLNITIAEVHSSIYYDNKVEISISQSGYATIDTLRVAATQIGYDDDLDFVKEYEKEYGTEILCFTVFNKEGTAYALNPKRDSGIKIAEHCLIFAYDLNSTGNEPIGCQSSVIAHETLHLYGAEDFYTPAERKPIAKKHYPNDIMLSCEYYLIFNNLGDATAFYIGWSDTAPPVLYEENW